MHPRQIPDEIFIGEPGFEERWCVEWVAPEHPKWTRVNRWGECDFSERTIRLDERLRHEPSRLREVWVHELQHAAYSYIRRPKGFDDKLEERVVTALSPILAYALAQTGAA